MRKHDSGRRDKGAVAVEAALVTPFILLILFGILEFGMLFKDWLGLVSSVRGGVRMASAEPRTLTFAQDAANQVANGSTALDMTSVQKLWVYKADAQGYPLGGGSAFTSCSTCVTFRWDTGTHKFVPVTNTWAPMSQDACAGETDSVGVYLEVRHQAFTGLFFQTLTLGEHSVMALEPMPVSSGCR
ncbi:TadE/TadG family type IV pilus assembly protein [Oryzihumus sp.]